MNIFVYIKMPCLRSCDIVKTIREELKRRLLMDGFHQVMCVCMPIYSMICFVMQLCLCVIAI